MAAVEQAKPSAVEVEQKGETRQQSEENVLQNEADVNKSEANVITSEATVTRNGASVTTTELEQSTSTGVGKGTNSEAADKERSVEKMNTESENVKSYLSKPNQTSEETAAEDAPVKENEKTDKSSKVEVKIEATEDESNVLDETRHINGSSVQVKDTNEQADQITELETTKKYTGREYETTIATLEKVQGKCNIQKDEVKGNEVKTDETKLDEVKISEVQPKLEVGEDAVVVGVESQQTVPEQTAGGNEILATTEQAVKSFPPLFSELPETKAESTETKIESMETQVESTEAKVKFTETKVESTDTNVESTDTKTESSETNVVAQESVDDWDIPASDEEDSDVSSEKPGDAKKTHVKRGYWEPPVEVIVELYKRLDKEGILELSWKCPGRRLPSEDGDKEEEENTVERTDEEQMEISKEEVPTEFDFDMDIDTTMEKVTPRRTLGSGQAQGSGKKRVARMDKVLNDIFRHRKIDSAMLEQAGKKSEKAVAIETDAMDTSSSAGLTPHRPLGKFRIRKDLNI